MEINMSNEDRTERHFHDEIFDNPEFYEETVLVGVPDEDGLISLFDAKEIPAVIGQYRIIEMIAQGGMGAIYRAEHIHLKRQVALKIINEKYQNDTNAEEWFKFETRIMGQLQHPNIVHMTDAGVDRGRRFLVMELLDGNDLSRHIKENGPLDFEDALAYLKQAALALGFAHLSGIIHRDVKPSNIFLTQEDRVKLLDLGLAQCTCKCASKDNAAERIAGSPGFMSPEQISGKPVDARSDLYSLGCTFYFMLTGKMPFAAPEYKNIHSVFRAHLYESLPQIEAIRGDVPETVARILDRMTAKRPEDRFQTMYELIDAIDDTGLVRYAVSTPTARRKRTRTMAVLSVAVTPVVLLLCVHLSQHHASLDAHSSEPNYDNVRLTVKPGEPKAPVPNENSAGDETTSVCPPELHAACVDLRQTDNECSTDQERCICFCASGDFFKQI